MAGDNSTQNREETLEQLQQLQYAPDAESAHKEADDLIVEFLIAQGFEEIADAYNEIEKWYA